MPTEPDTRGNEPNLELPSLSRGFGRKKKRESKANDDAPATPVDNAEEPRDADAPADTTHDPIPDPAPAAIPQAASPPRPTPARAPARPAAPAAPASTPGAVPARAPARPAARPAARPVTPAPSAASPTIAAPTPSPAAAPAPTTQPDLPRPAVAPPEPALAAVPQAEAAEVPEAVEAPEVAVEAVAPESKAPEPVAAPEAADEPTVAVEDLVEAADEPTIPLEKLPKPPVVRSPKAVKVSTVPESRRAKARARREAHEKSKAEKAAIRAQERTSHDRPAPAELLVSKLPGIKPVYAALLTGLISGLICVLLAKGASVGCEAIRDDDSCGGGLGLLALVAILAIEVLIGANLLKAWKVADPFSTSFLGVGLVAMVSMLFFLKVLDSDKMLVVIPLITAVSFLISWWVTVRFVEEQDDEPEAA